MPRRIARGLVSGALALALAAAAAPASLVAPAAADRGDDTQHRGLQYGPPARAGLVGEHLAGASGALREFLQPSPTHPQYAGGTVLAARHGVIALHDAAGQAVRYQDAETELPREEWVPARRDTIYDLASVTKTFTAIVVMQQVEDGRLDLDEPVATYLPDFAAHGKDDVTVRDLLTHTGGLPAWLPLYSAHDTVAEREAAVLAAEPVAAPGEQYLYSDLGLITLGLLVEHVTGKSLDRVVADDVTGPLRMSDTMYNPPADLRDRIAATEAQPWVDRPMIRGEVHDENAWSLGGVAGHAGLFSSAHDLAVLAQTLLDGGTYRRTRILERASVEAMLTDENTEFPGDSHGLGFELDQRWYMDALSSPESFGHTGFTGTSMVVDPLSDTFVILLTNRVHPTRDWGSNNPARRAVARAVARAVPVRPTEGRDAWFSGIEDETTTTLTLPVATTGTGDVELDFDLWYDTEEGSDLAHLERSTDGGKTWEPVPFTLTRDGTTVSTDGSVSGFGDRAWHRGSAVVPATDGEQLLRWRYTTDGLYQGRGVYVDRLRLEGPDGVRVPVEPVADGWTRSRN